MSAFGGSAPHLGTRQGEGSQPETKGNNAPTEDFLEYLLEKLIIMFITQMMMLTFGTLIDCDKFSPQSVASSPSFFCKPT